MLATAGLDYLPQQWAAAGSQNPLGGNSMQRLQRLQGLWHKTGPAGYVRLVSVRVPASWRACYPETFGRRGKKGVGAGRA